jgi:hypothetical protein
MKGTKTLAHTFHTASVPASVIAFFVRIVSNNRGLTGTFRNTLGFERLPQYAI